MNVAFRQLFRWQWFLYLCCGWIPLGAPGAAGAQPLSLAQCLALALEQSPQTQRNRQSLERSQLQLQAQRAPFEPRLQLNMTLPSYVDNRQLLVNEALSSRVRDENTALQYLGSLELSQRVRSLGRFTLSSQSQLYDFSSNRQAPYRDYRGDLALGYSQSLFAQPAEEVSLAQAELGLAGARLNFGRAQFQLEAQVTQAYYALVSVRSRLDIDRQTLERSRVSLELARRKVEVGFLDETEALRLEVDMLQAEASYTRTQSNIERARDRLREVLGVDWDQPLEVEGLPEGAFQKYPISLEKAVAMGLSRRPDLQASLLDEESQRLSLRSVRSQTGPTATLNATVGLRGQGDKLSDVHQRLERNQWGMNIQVRAPLIDGGARRSQVRQQELALEQLQTNQELLRQSIVLQIRDAVNSLKEAERQIELSQAALSVAEKTFAREQQRFDLGLSRSQDMLIAQGQLTSARTNALDARIGYYLQIDNLRQATTAELSELVEVPGN
ncbi:MAG: TolC family protein [Candidatus Latescibacteria bacterium]|nr:TolC family protein [Candidatus Latescibacterota bacterium]